LYSVGIILAAGQGTRMRPLTEHTPKPLLKIGDLTLLQRQINFIGKQVSSVGVSVGYKSDAVSQHAISTGADFILDIENGGNASWLNFDSIRNMNAQIVIITSDNLMEVDLEMLEQETSQFPENSFIVSRKENGREPGDRIEFENTNITRISPNSNSPYLATGLQVLNPSILDRETIYQDFHEVWNDLIEKRMLTSSKFEPSVWSAIDTPEDLQREVIKNSKQEL